MLKILGFISNLCLIMILVLGALQLHWFSIFISAIILTIIRILYIQAEKKAEISSADQTIVNSSPSVRYFAGFITSILISSIAYFLGYGVRYIINLFIS